LTVGAEPQQLSLDSILWLSGADALGTWTVKHRSSCEDTADKSSLEIAGALPHASCVAFSLNNALSLS